MHRTIDDVEFTIFDTETTGLDPVGGDRIIEIAALRIKADKVLGKFQSLVNPQRDISAAAYQVNKISNAMVADAPMAKDVLPGFLDFIKGSCLCSYNMPFDLGFLENELQIFLPQTVMRIACADILSMARRLLPDLERHALWYVSRSLGISQPQEHRALADVEMTLQVFHLLKNLLKEKGLDNYRSFLGLFGVSSRISEDANAWKLAEIQQAIDMQGRIRIVYFSRQDSSVSQREVIPKEIREDRKQKYLLGYCCLRNQERLFRIDSITHLEPV